ncbi:MAG: hypothetical protein ABI151_00205, partial [Chitinophagaceae bacterium]
PENFELDLFSGWAKNVKHRVAYIYDTLEPQFPLIKKLFSNDDFNLKITSFNDAVPLLETLTGKNWYCIEQAVPEGLFTPVAQSEKVIDFSSYGRKLPVFHAALLEFCKVNGLYYDYTTHAFNHPVAPEDELYRQYAWHLTHSKFTVSWPVEVTNPTRAGVLHPVTCRWFEAAASATIIIGRQPANDQFEKMLAPNLVVEIDPFEAKPVILSRLDQIYNNYERLQENAFTTRVANLGRWTWKNKVERMRQLVGEAI